MEVFDVVGVDFALGPFNGEIRVDELGLVDLDFSSSSEDDEDDDESVEYWSRLGKGKDLFNKP